MKEASAHINTPALNRTQPFFQRSAEENREDSAFFSGVQAKLNVGAKDDPDEKEADAKADKVVNKKTIQAKLTVGEKDDPYEKEADAMADKVVNKKPGDVQMKTEEKEEEKKEVKEESTDKKINKKPVAYDDNNDNKVQRMCRECDEGDRIFRASGDPDISGMSKGEAVIAMAKTMLGKIKAKQSGGGGERYGAKELWEIFKLAAPGIWSEEDIKTLGKPYPSWCGIFSVWAHKKAGIDLGNWQMGKGVTAFGTLKPTTSPQPGDIGYIDQPYQHHCIVTKVNGDTIDSIDGNSGWFSEVIENTRPRTAYTGFFTAFSGSDSGTANKKDTEGSVQKQPDKNAGTAPSSVESSLASSKGGGSSLPAASKTEMESGLGADFSNVKIHTGSNAVQMSKDLNAQAFTHGADIYFNENKFNPDTSSGKHLLAHELTHTMQQGAAGVQKKSSSKLPRILNKINRKPTDDAEGLAVGDVYEINFKDRKKHTLDRGKMVLEMPEITLPALKKRNQDKYKFPILSMKGRGKTLQVDNWEKAVSSKVNAKLAERFKKDDPNWKPSDILYYKLKARKDFHLIGTIEQLQKLSYIPRWNRKGQPNFHQVDHIVEYQLGGSDMPETTPTNYELLDAKANMSSGSAIRKQRQKRVEESLAFFKEMHTNKKSKVYKKFTYLPKPEKVLKEWEMQFKAVTKDWNLPSRGDGNTYWTYEEMAGPGDPVFLEHIEKMNSTEVAAARGTPNEILIYAGEAVGGAKKLKMPFKGPIKDFFLGMNLTSINITGGSPGQKAGEIKFELNRDFTKKVKDGANPEFELIAVSDGRPDTYFIKPKQDFNKNLFKKFEGLSPIVVNDLQVDSAKGIMLTGTITADVPLFKGFEIDFAITAEGFMFSTMIDASVISNYFPKPFVVNNANLEISYTSKNNSINLLGNIDFEIEKLGKGKLTAGKKGEGFMVSGDFNFDPNLFVGELHFSYIEEKWTIGGSATMDGKKLKGVKSAKIKFEYSQANENLHVGGEAYLTVPGISRVTIDTNIGKDGDFKVTADVTLENVPRIKSGQVKVTIGKTKPPATQPGTAQPEGDSEWDLGIEGTIEPDFDYDGLTTKAEFSYAKGAYDISITGSYKRGKIHAEEIKVGLTNKKVSADGKIMEGEPTKDMTFYGGLKMSVDIYDGIGGKIACVLKPDGDITLDGSVEVEEDKQLFSVEPLDKTIAEVDKDIPIASCVVVTLNLFIGGKIQLYANVKPLMIKKGSFVKVGNLSLKKYDDPQITSKIILGSSLIAGAKVTLAVGLSASLLGIIKARIKGQAGVDFVALDATLTGILEMGWSKGKGLEINEASISAEIESKLKVSFAVVAEVLIDLWLTTISVWDHTWPVAEETFPINLFGKGKKTWKLPIENGGKVGQPKMEDNLKEVNDKATPAEVQTRAENKSKGIGQTAEDKQAQIQQVTQDEVIANFKHPDRLKFDRSENYLETRYGLYNYLKLNSGLDPKIDLNFIDEEIKKCEFEEYDAFSLYIMNDTSFNDDSKSIIIEDFIVNHPTLGATEIANLRSLIPVKAPASQKPSVKEKGKSVPKKTSDVTTPTRPIQKKSIPGARTGSGSSGAKKGKGDVKNRSQKNNNKANEGNEFNDTDDGILIPDMEIQAIDDLYESTDELVEKDPSALTTINGFEEDTDTNENDHFKPFYMRPYTRTRKPLQQRAEEKSKPFFSGPEKKEKKANNSFFQAKLNVGETDDPLEKEADRVADTVTGKGVQKEERKEDIAKGAGIGKPEQEANKGKTPGADKPPVAEKAAMQEEKKEKPTVQKKGNNEKEEENNTPVNKKEKAPAHTAAKANSVESAIGQKNGKGESMPANTLQEMQNAFGNDFSEVRIHTDSEAAALSNELDAQAFTTGKDIYFNTGKFDPDSESGKHLLAHELTHVLQQNKDSIQRDPKKDKEEKDRAQKVRDNYQKALKAKSVNWEEVALYFNAFNTAEQLSKMAQLNGSQLFQLHQGAVNAAGVGPWSAAALITTPIPGMESAVAAAIEEKMLGYNYQEAINLMIEDLDKKGIIDRTLLWGGTMKYLDKSNLGGEGRILAPGFNQTTGKANPTSANIGSDAFGHTTGLPLLYSTIIHEYQHVQQMQKKDESKALIPDQGNDDNTHLQQEVEAYATELVRAKESGLFHNAEQVEGAWNRLQSKWEGLSEDRKKPLNDLYKKAYKVAKEALGKKSFLVYTPLK